MQKVYYTRNQVAQSAGSVAVKWFADRALITKADIAREAVRQTGEDATFYALTNMKHKDTGEMVCYSDSLYNFKSTYGISVISHSVPFWSLPDRNRH